MKKPTYYYRIRPGQMKRLGANIGNDLQSDISLVHSGEPIKLGEIGVFSPQEDDRLDIAVRILELEDQPQNNDEGAGKISISFPAKPGNYTFQIPIVVESKGKERVKSSLFIQHVNLEISSEADMAPITGQIQIVDLDINPGQNVSFNDIPALFTQGNIFNRPAHAWEFGGLMGVEGTGVRNGRSAFSPREFQLMAFQRDRETGLILETNFAPATVPQNRISQGIFEQEITPFSNPIEGEIDLDEGLAAAFQHLPKISPIASLEVSHVYSYVPPQVWLDLFPEWETDIPSKAGIWAMLQINETGGKLVVFSAALPDKLLLELPVPPTVILLAEAMISSPIILAGLSQNLQVGLKLGSALAILVAAFASATVVPIVLILAALSFQLAIIKVIMEINSAAQAETNQAAVKAQLKQLQATNAKLLGEVEAQRADILKLQKAGAKDSAQGRKFIKETIERLEKLMQEHKKACEADPKLVKDSYPKAFQDLLDYLEKFIKTISDKLG